MKGLIFTYLLTYGGAAASLLRPFYGLLIYFTFAIIKPESLWYWSVPAGNYSRIVAIALLIGWAINGFGNWQFGRARPILFSLLGFLGWSAVAGVFAEQSSVVISWLEQYLKIVLPFLVGITIVQTVGQLRVVAWVLTLAQGYVAYDLNMSYYGGFNRLDELGFGGMDNNCVCISMVAGAGLAFFLGIAEDSWWRKVVAFACAALMAHCPMFGMSRGGMLGLIVTGIVGFVLIPKRPRDYAAFALAVVVALSLAGPSVIERFAMTFAKEEERDASAQSRLDFWKACWQTMQDEPLFGVGPDHWPRVVHRFGFPKGVEAHSLWFQTGAETGFPGLGFLLAFYGFAVLRSWRVLRRGGYSDPWAGHLLRMVIAAIVGFGVSASFVSLEGLEIPYYIVLIAAGVLKIGLDEGSGDESEDEAGAEAEESMAGAAAA